MIEVLRDMNSGAQLWQRAKQIIPGGNQLLSKRAEMFLPGSWPAFYKKAKGVEVWDLDDNHYYDMSIMAIGACALGYANDDVDQAVKSAIEQGSMCTLNCYEEVELAEKLIELHPWADMVRFARTGGEACAIAVRIARAFSQKDKVAFCGYHGWCDWYLSANLADSRNLDGQLLPGLEPAGVPRVLKNTAIPFSYGNLEELKDIVVKNSGDVGVIIMEVERNKGLDKSFLQGVREIASEIGAVLIFDEVSSGFRKCTGGMHMHPSCQVEPDIVVLAKALGNGYPIAAVVGREQVMDAAQETFISSTYWTGRVGFSAALATIKQFEEKNVAEYLIDTGSYIKKELRQILVSKNMDIEIAGLDPIPTMVIEEDNPEIIKTILTQEMLKRGFLASNVIFVSFAHTKEIIDEYLKEVDEVFGLIASALKSGKLESLLEGAVCHSGFKRLT